MNRDKKKTVIGVKMLNFNPPSPYISESPIFIYFFIKFLSINMEKEDYLKGFDDAIDLFFNIVKDKIGLEKLRETGIVDIYLKLKDLTAQHKVEKFREMLSK